jgi:hypothetical protein
MNSTLANSEKIYYNCSQLTAFLFLRSPPYKEGSQPLALFSFSRQIDCNRSNHVSNAQSIRAFIHRGGSEPALG